MSGIKGLNSVKIEVTWKSILTLGCCAFSLETFAFFKNSLKTNKKNNPARIITSGSGTALENLSISLPRSFENRHKNTGHATYVKHS